MQKILLDDVGLEYICTTAERFFAVGRVLGNMVAALAEQPSSRLLKHIIRCYLRLSDNPRYVCQLHMRFFIHILNQSPCIHRACDALRSCLPDMLRDATFSSCLRVSANGCFLDEVNGRSSRKLILPCFISGGSNHEKVAAAVASQRSRASGCDGSWWF